MPTLGQYCARETAMPALVKTPCDPGCSVSSVALTSGKTLSCRVVAVGEVVYVCAMCHLRDSVYQCSAVSAVSLVTRCGGQRTIQWYSPDSGALKC